MAYPVFVDPILPCCSQKFLPIALATVEKGYLLFVTRTVLPIEAAVVDAVLVVVAAVERMMIPSFPILFLLPNWVRLYSTILLP